MITDPYAVLGVPRTASKEEIKKAYRAKAKMYHPDLHPDDPAAAEKMNEVNQAYDMINNPEKYRQTSGYSSYGQRTGSTYSGSSADNERRYTYNTYGDQDPWVMFDDLFRSFEEQARQSQQRDDYYRQQQENNPNYQRYSSNRGCLKTILRWVLIWLLISVFFRSCGGMLVYGPGYNYRYEQQYEQPEDSQELEET